MRSDQPAAPTRDRPRHDLLIESGGVIEPLRREFTTPMRTRPNSSDFARSAHAVDGEHRQGEACTHAEFVDRYVTAAVNRSVSTESTCPMSRDQAAFAEFSTHGCTATSPKAVA